MHRVFRELIVRWFQFGAFCPIFRLHGNRGGPKDVDVCGHKGYNEIWHFGHPAYEAIASVMRLRESLRPYVASHLEQARLDRTPPLSSLAMRACPDDLPRSLRRPPITGPLSFVR
mgnify:CR=1 FL=1